MTAKLRFLFWIGVVLLFVPVLGVRSGIRTVITVALGIFVIYLTLRLRRSYKELRYQLRQQERGSDATPTAVSSRT